MTRLCWVRDVAARLLGNCCPLVVLISLLCGGSSAPASTRVATVQNERATELLPNRRVERDLSGTETHIYKIMLSAGDYLRVFINPNPQSTKIRSQLLAPGGSSDVGVYFLPTGGQDRYVSLIAEVSGDYGLQIRSDESAASLKHYEITVEEMRPATEQDRTHVSAESAEYQGLLLMRGQGREPGSAWQECIHKFEE